MIPLRERKSMRFSLTKPDTRGRALVLERTALRWAGLRGEPEGRVLPVPDDVWDHPVVSTRQLHLSIIDPFKLGQELFVQHLVGSVRDVILVWEPVVRIGQTGGQVLYEQTEQQLSLVRLRQQRDQIKSKRDLSDVVVTGQRLFFMVTLT